MREKIKLTSFQAVSYWWIKRIQSMVKGLEKYGFSSNEARAQLQGIIAGLTDEDLRTIYMELADRIEQNYNNNNKYEETTAQNMFGNHDVVSACLEDVLCVNIPKTSIGGNGCYHKKISIREENGVPVARISGVDLYGYVAGVLETEYSSNFILTGEKEQEEFCDDEWSKEN